VSLRTVYQRVIAHRGVIAFALIFAFCIYPLIDLGKFGPTRVAFRVILVMFIASQLFWIRRALDLGERFIPGMPRRTWLAAIACFVELVFFVYSYSQMGGLVHLFLASKIIGAADPRLRSVLMEGALSWWLAGSVLGFGLVIVFGAVDRVVSAAAWVYRKERTRAVGMNARPSRVSPVVGGREGICYLIFTPFVAKVTVHGPSPFETSSFAVKDVGVTSTMLKRHFADSPHSASSSGHTQVFPLTLPPLLNVPPGPVLVILYWL